MISRRLEQWRSISKTERRVYQIFVAAITIPIVYGLLLDWNQWPGLWINFGTGMLGALVTFFLIDQVIGGKEKLRQNQISTVVQLRQADSPEKRNPIIGIMKNMELFQSVDMQAVVLRRANLANINFSGAHLEMCDFSEGAILNGANLEGVYLSYAHLDGTEMINANLRNAQLYGAILSGANLKGASLINAQLGTLDGNYTRFDSQTTLPDGKRWTQKEDMRRFTDPSHKDFYVCDDDKASPIYRGKLGIHAWRKVQ